MLFLAAAVTCPRLPAPAHKPLSPNSPETPMASHRLISILLLALAAPFGVTHASAQGVPSLYEPGISPDGSQIAFVSGGDMMHNRAYVDDMNEEMQKLEPDFARGALYSPGGQGFLVLPLNQFDPCAMLPVESFASSTAPAFSRRVTSSDV